MSKFETNMLDEFLLQEITANCLEEDVWDEDHTSVACIPKDQKSIARLLIKADGLILGGVGFAVKAFKCIDEELSTTIFIEDGSPCKKGDVAFHVEGYTQSILKSERIILNVMQRMTGIATETNYFVNLAKKHNIKVLDTRKTAPGIRILDKWAVHLGGGTNHRMGLSDAIMIKDNHIDSVGSISKAISKVHEYLKDKNLKLPIIVETRNLEEVSEVLSSKKVDRILVDNFNPEAIKEVVKLINGACKIEVSGGIKKDNFESYLIPGIDFISMGSITHSVLSADLSLKINHVI